MSLTSKIIKEFSINIEKLLIIMFGDTYDSEGNKYQEVYAYELSSFFSSLERSLGALEDNKVEINREVLKSHLITKWFNILDRCDMNSLNDYLLDILTVSKINVTAEESLRLTEEDNNYLRKIIREEMNRNMNILINLSLKNETQMTQILLDFKKNDNAHYEHLIYTFKQAYIRGANLLYMLYKEQPKDWSTGLSLHETVCRDFDIKREEFLF
ncbi:MAG: hypothetical protein K0R54_240 [Clostridiaceae bacterium]|jgi:hypothetical protein|nr:hypothetical protein [Clostridiaceae bacterium]